MLVYSGRSVFNSPQRFSGPYANQSGNIVKGGNRNRFVGGLDATFGAYPNGHLAPSSFILPQKSGSISSYKEAQEFITGVASLTPAQPMIASATLQITLTNAQLDQIVQAIASGTISIAASQAILAGAANADASGTCTLTVDSALCGAIFSVLASSNGVITPSVTISALAHMDAEAGGPTPLSPEGLASAVWGANAADNNDSGTMGELLNNSGGGSSPSAIALEVFDNQDIETGYSLREALRIVLAALGGKVSGAGTSTITIRSAADDKDRIIATVDSNGNRTAVTLDVT